MNIGRIGSILPKVLLVGAVAAGAAVLLSACGGSRGRRPEEEAAELLGRYDRGKTGADQAATGERSLSVDGEQRVIVHRSVMEDRGYYSDGYRRFDEVQDISKLLTAADANGSGDATLSELTTAIRKFDRTADGFLDRSENTDYELEYGPSLREINVTYDRDLNENGQDAVVDGIGTGLDWIFGD